VKRLKGKSQKNPLFFLQSSHFVVKDDLELTLGCSTWRSLHLQRQELTLHAKLSD